MASARDIRNRFTIRHQSSRSGRSRAWDYVAEALERRILLSGINFAAPTYPTGEGLIFVASADFNGDGKPDLAAADHSDPHKGMSVLLNRGDGTFAPAVAYGTASSPDSVITADFNADGKPDLAVTNYDPGSHGISVFLNNGEGTFAPKVDYGTGTNPGSPAAADFNGDAKIDLAVPNWVSNTLSILLNKGDGTFDPKIDYATNSYPGSVTAADFNGDGRPDVAIANGGTDSVSVSVLLNKGNGSFAPKVDYHLANVPSSVTAADFDGDGKLDLAVPNGINTVTILLNNGNGSFATGPNYSTGTRPYFVAAGDFNGDGKSDLAAVSGNNNSVGVLLNYGNGVFAPTIEYGAGADPHSLVVADFNSDGKADLAVGNTGNVSVLLNNGDATFIARRDYGTGSYPTSVTAADFNGDGSADLVVANALSDTNSLLLNDSHGVFSVSADYNTGSHPISVVAADLNGDTKADLAVANSGSNTISVLMNNGNGTFAPKVDYDTGPLPSAVAAADLNGDGKPDLAVANQDSNSVGLLMNNGDGTFGPRVDYLAGPWPIAVTAAEFNGDGKLDLAVANAGGVRVLLNNGNGTFADGDDYHTPYSPSSLAAADFNGDGKADLAVPNYGYGGKLAHDSLSILVNDGDGTFSSKADYVAGLYPAAVAAADLNGDGNVDLAVTDYADNVSLWLNNGDATFAKTVAYTTSSDPKSVSAADLNGDGKPDLAVANHGGNSISVLLNKNAPYRCYWTGGGDGINWIDSGNWSGDSVPGASDDAVLDVPGNPAINVQGAQSLRSVSSSEILDITGSVSIAAASEFRAAVTLSGTFGGSGDATFTNVLTWSGSSMSGSGMTIIAPGARLNVVGSAGSLRCRAMEIDGQASLAAGGDKVLVTPKLIMGSAGRLDLADNTLIVDYTGASPVGAIQSMLTRGYASGAWNGNGISSSLAATTAHRALGFAEATDIGSPRTFAGVWIDNSAVVVHYTVAGDANLDAKVDVSDLGIVATNMQNSSGRWSLGDFNYDQVVDVADLRILASNWQSTLAAAPVSATASLTKGGRSTPVRAVDLVM